MAVDPNSGAVFVVDSGRSDDDTLCRVSPDGGAHSLPGIFAGLSVFVSVCVCVCICVCVLACVCMHDWYAVVFVCV